MSTTEQNVYGMLAEFEDAGALLRAARKVREAGYSNFDAHSPFPIHGMDEAMGEQRSPLGWIVGIMGLIGGGGALLMQWWTSAVNYPVIVGGKPFFSLPAFIPITFELTILLAAFGAVFGMLYLNRLPKLFHPNFFSNRFERVTDGGFFMSIEASDPQFEVDRTRSYLESLGSTGVEVIPASETEGSGEEQ